MGFLSSISKLAVPLGMGLGFAVGGPAGATIGGQLGGMASGLAYTGEGYNALGGGIGEAMHQQKMGVIELEQQYEKAKKLLEPYNTAGLNALGRVENRLNTPITTAEFMSSPEYDVASRLYAGDQNKVINMLSSQPFGKGKLAALNEFRQTEGMRSYQDFINNMLATNLNPNMELANMGSGATTNMANLTKGIGDAYAGLGNDTANLLQLGGQARGNRAIAEGNVLSSGFGNIANYLMTSSLFNKPGTTGGKGVS